MTSIFFALDSLIVWLCVASLALASVFLGILVIAGAGDVITTTVLHSPVPSALEISEISLVAIVFLGLAQAQHKNAHITVDILAQNLKGPMRWFSRALAHVGAIVFFFAIGWYGLLEAIHSYGINEVADGLYPIPKWPARFLLAFGCIIAGCEAVRQLIRHALGLTVEDQDEHLEEASL